jgi:hypothetical protein
MAASDFYRNVFSLLKNTRLALGYIPVGEEFKLQIAEPNGEVTKETIGSLQASLVGKTITTELGIYKVAGIIVCKDTKDVSFMSETVKVIDKELLSTRELLSNSKFCSIAEYISGVAKAKDPSKVMYTVVGKVGLHNRMSLDAVKERRLRYLPECYDGNPGYQAVVSSIDSFATSESIAKYQTAVRTLLASGLRAGVEKEEGMRMLTIVVTAKLQ